MTEYLAIPAWSTPPRSLDDWKSRLASLGHPATSRPEPPEGTWLDIPSLRLRGLAVVEDGKLSAIYFELDDPDPSAALAALESAADALGWEVHADEEDEED